MAKPITISVPNDLAKELKKLPEIKVSAVCQAALKNKVEDLKSQNAADDDLLSFAEKRLTKQFTKEMGEYWDIWFEAGEAWAAQVADFEELKKLCERGGGDEYPRFRDLFDELRYGGRTGIPEEILHRDEDGEDQFPDAFEQGVMSMWKKIKERMEKKGFGDYFIE